MGGQRLLDELKVCITALGDLHSGGLAAPSAIAISPTETVPKRNGCNKNDRPPPASGPRFSRNSSSGSISSSSSSSGCIGSDGEAQSGGGALPVPCCSPWLCAAIVRHVKCHRRGNVPILVVSTLPIRLQVPS